MNPFLPLQEKAGWSPGAGRHDTTEEWTAEEGGSGAGRHLSHMPQDKVRGRSGAYLQLLQHSLLCTVRREGHTSLKQGKSKLILPKLERGQHMVLFVGYCRWDRT